VRVLFDENLDHRLRNYLGEHDVVTVGYMGWGGLRNGELLWVAEKNGIQVFITGDRTLSYEQNLAGRQLSIIVLSSIELPILRNHLSVIVDAIGRAFPGSFQAVDCGTFRRQ